MKQYYQEDRTILKKAPEHFSFKALFIKEKKTSKKEVFLRKALHDAQQSLQDAYEGLSNVNEPELIDSYIYELNAASLRYKLILQEYRELTRYSKEDSRDNFQCREIKDFLDEDYQIRQINPEFHSPTPCQE